MVADPIDTGAIPSGNLEVLARFRNAEPSGVVVTPDGKIFLTFPRITAEQKGPTLARLEGNRLVPFPDAAWNQEHGEASSRFVSALGLTLDAQGRLWVLDEGRAAKGVTEHDGPKLVAFDPSSGKLLQRVVLRAPALMPDSHVNDLRVDARAGHSAVAYISDSSYAEHPAMMMVDLATGQQKRLLCGSPSVSADKGFTVMLDGRVSRYSSTNPTAPQAGIDGIAVTPDGSRIYYQPLFSRHLFSVSTEALRAAAGCNTSLASQVREEGETGMVDGMTFAADGTLYLTDIERHAILQRSRIGGIQVLAHDPRLLSPDGIFVDEHYVYVSVGQWYRLAAFHGGVDQRKPPYLLVRIKR
ncbi:MAG: L-dopachrome tautomerase-related protein [Acidobacteriaceae bacterium]|nr:L-dopachrome tautomerase-related protein [Acidobacteriaceae bacterium]